MLLTKQNCQKKNKKNSGIWLDHLKSGKLVRFGQVDINTGQESISLGMPELPIKGTAFLMSARPTCVLRFISFGVSPRLLDACYKSWKNPVDVPPPCNGLTSYKWTSRFHQHWFFSSSYPNSWPCGQNIFHGNGLLLLLSPTFSLSLITCFNF